LVDEFVFDLCRNNGYIAQPLRCLFVDAVKSQEFFVDPLDFIIYQTQHQVQVRRNKAAL
jgi:hypothetical protein